MTGSIWISSDGFDYYVNLANERGETVDVAGPFDDCTDAVLASERIADCLAGVLG